MIFSKTNNKKKKIIDFKSRKKKIELNIGLIVFFVIFIYIIGITYNYFTAHNISTYEVRYGSIIDDTAYNGLIIREEQIFNSADSGYIQFYYLQGSRVSVDNNIYTISESNEDVTQYATSDTDDYSLSTTDQQSILSEIQTFNNAYSSTNFDLTYELKDTLESIIENRQNDEKISVLDELDATDSTFNLFKSDSAGIILYTIDNYEDVTLSNFTSELFDGINYNSTSISTGDKVTMNTPIYKLVTSEDWYIVFEIAENDIETFSEMTSVELKFVSDGEVTSADFSTMVENDINYGVISMNTGMIRYIDSRFVDIELIFDELEGYKIPISSVITRDFYQIPLSYITKGGASGSNGVILQNDDGTATFQEANVYYQDDDYAYIAASVFELGGTIIMEETSDTMIVSEIIELDGVYNVNKGYAEFKCVTILAESSEYYIVDDSMSYSINNYDHIALDGSTVEEYVVLN